MDLDECDVQDENIVDVDIAVDGEDIVEGEIDVESDCLNLNSGCFKYFS